jgi:hypothetical protein
MLIIYIHNVDMLCNTYLFGCFGDRLFETARLGGILIGYLNFADLWHHCGFQLGVRPQNAS